MMYAGSKTDLVNKVTLALPLLSSLGHRNVVADKNFGDGATF